LKLGLSAITGFRYHKPALSSTALQGTVIMSLIGEILLFGLNVYFYIIIASVIISWLIAFEVLNTSNPQAQNLVRLLNKATEPVYKPLRKYIPAIAGIDITPIIVVFGIFLLQRLVVRVFLYHPYAPFY
jgi:YggT family protein